MNDYSNAGDIDVFSTYKRNSKIGDSESLKDVSDFVRDAYDGTYYSEFSYDKNTVIHTDTYKFQVMSGYFIKPFTDTIAIVTGKQIGRAHV